MNEENTRLLVERCPVGLSLHGERGQFTAANDECARVFGRSKEDLLRGALTDVIDLRDVERVQSEWASATLVDQDRTFAYRLADGASYVETDVRVHGGPGGRVIACASRRRPSPEAGPSLDALDRRNLELARSHRDALVHMLPALIWFGPVTPDLQRYKLSYLNEYLFNLAGYTREEWFETPGFWRGIVHPDDLERALEMTARMLRGEVTTGLQYRLRTRSGEYLWVQSSIHIERDEAGVAVRMYGVTLDVTAIVETRRRNEALLNEVTEKTREIQSLSAPIIPLGTDIVIMPLLGVLDQGRVERAMETLMRRVRDMGARRVIIDLTDVRSIDVQSLEALTRVAAAVRMLGARTMLTGISPEVALGMLELGRPMDGLRSYRSLLAAIRAP